MRMRFSRAILVARSRQFPGERRTKPGSRRASRPQGDGVGFALVDATMALGTVYGEEGKHADSLRLLREAATLHPNAALIWKTWATSSLCRSHRLGRAAWRRGRDLDPAAPRSTRCMDDAVVSGKAREAEEEVRAAWSSPGSVQAADVPRDSLYYQGNRRGMQAFDRAVQVPRAVMTEADRHFWHLACRARRTRQIDPRIFQTSRPRSRRERSSRNGLAQCLCPLGEKQPALAWLKHSRSTSRS